MWSRSGWSSPSGMCSASWSWVYVSVAQAIPMRFLFDEMQDDVFGEAPQGRP